VLALHDVRSSTWGRDVAQVDAQIASPSKELKTNIQLLAKQIGD